MPNSAMWTQNKLHSDCQTLKTSLRRQGKQIETFSDMTMKSEIQDTLYKSEHSTRHYFQQTHHYALEHRGTTQTQYYSTQSFKVSTETQTTMKLRKNSLAVINTKEFPENAVPALKENYNWNG